MSGHDFSRSMPNMILRYVPPGCAQSANVGVRLTPERDEGHIGFVGNWKAKTTRKPWAWAVRPNDHMIDSRSTWRAYLEKYPIQLSLHSSFNGAKAFEDIRAAQALVNGACFLSETSAELDEENWKDVVRFVRDDEVDKVLQWLVDNHTAIVECQEKSKETFCSPDSPHSPKNVIIQESAWLQQTTELTSVQQQRSVDDQVGSPSKQFCAKRKAGLGEHEDAHSPYIPLRREGEAALLEGVACADVREAA
eukprot:1448667-Amphidinium_carterae.1